jgi:hypothetical protein
VSADVRGRLALLLLTAGLLLPRAADAQVMREFGAFGNFGGGSNFGVNMGNPMFGAPQQESGIGGASFGNGNGGGAGMAPNSELSGVSLELRGMNGWSASANFDSELSSPVRAHTGKAVVRYAW